MAKKAIMQLYLHHGRTSPDEDLDDWGPNATPLQGVNGIHQTYGGPANVFFASDKALREARRLTGWERWEDRALTMRWDHEFVVCECDGVKMYYGDWGVL